MNEIPQDYDVAISAGASRMYAVRLPKLDDRVEQAGVVVGVVVDGVVVGRSVVPADKVENFALAVDGGGELMYFGKANPERHEIRASLAVSVLARRLLGLTRDEPVDASEPWLGTRSVPVGRDERVLLFVGYCTARYDGELSPLAYVAHFGRIMDGHTHDPVASAIDELLEGL